MFHALVAATALYAAAPLDATHAAVFEVISRGDDAAGCSAGQKQKLAAEATIRKLGRVGNDDVVLAQVGGGCICGAQNCPYFAIRLAPGNPRVLVDTYAVGMHFADHAQPLPGLVFDAHDSAMVAVETVYAFRGGKYLAIADSRVRWSDHVHKPNRIPVRFAPGASSAKLHGTASMGWYDIYGFDAAKGQRVTIDGVTSKSNVTITLFPPDGASTALKPGVPFVLPRSGSYRVQVETDSETDAPYTLSLAIR